MKAKAIEETSDDSVPPEREANSDGYEYPSLSNDKGGAADDSLLVGSVANTREKKYPKHLWHAALALILERGRPVTSTLLFILPTMCANFLRSLRASGGYI